MIPFKVKTTNNIFLFPSHTFTPLCNKP